LNEKHMGDPKNVREMNLETDFYQVRKIWLHGAKKSHRKFIPETFWDSKKVLDNFQTEISNPQNDRYVYKDEKNEIRGFITARKDGYIFELYVDFREEDFRGRGIGKVLFETLQGKNPKFPQLIDRYSQFTSSVYAHNHKSFAWHIKQDFKVFGIRFCPDTGLPKFEMIWKKDRREGARSS
jgi:ribosomal protein S18 acetylase RimI-like enzyme